MFTRNEIDDRLPAPTRRHHPWHEMEEYHPHGGMWAPCSPAVRGSLAAAAADLLSDPPRFLNGARRVAQEWPNSTGVALTSPGLNARAWMGQAVCFLLVSCPEEVTRLAWHQLTIAQQTAANACVDTVITEWAAANAAPITEGLW